MHILAGLTRGLSGNLTAVKKALVPQSYSVFNNRAETEKVKKLLEAEVVKAMREIRKFVSKHWGESNYLFNNLEFPSGPQILLWNDDIVDDDGFGVFFQLTVDVDKSVIWGGAWYDVEGDMDNRLFDYSTKPIKFKEGINVGSILVSIFSDKKKWSGAPLVRRLRDVADEVDFSISSRSGTLSQDARAISIAGERLSWYLRNKLKAGYFKFHSMEFEKGALYGIGEEIDGKVPMVSLFLGDDFKSVCLSVSVVDQTSGKAVYGSFVSSTAGDYSGWVESFLTDSNWAGGKSARNAKAEASRFIKFVDKNRARS